MTQFGYTAMGEQTPTRQMVKDLVQIGAERQHDFIAWAGNELLPALRDLG